MFVSSLSSLSKQLPFPFIPPFRSPSISPSPPSILLLILSSSSFSLLFSLIIQQLGATSQPYVSGAATSHCSIILSLLTIRLKLCLKPLVIPVFFNSRTNYPSTSIHHTCSCLIISPLCKCHLFLSTIYSMLLLYRLISKTARQPYVNMFSCFLLTTISFLICPLYFTLTRYFNVRVCMCACVHVCVCVCVIYDIR